MPRVERNEEKDDKESEKKPRAKKLVAKREFTISHNGYHRVIRAGDDLSDVPELYLENLKTEQVI